MAHSLETFEEAVREYEWRTRVDSQENCHHVMPAGWRLVKPKYGSYATVKCVHCGGIIPIATTRRMGITSITRDGWKTYS